MSAAAKFKIESGIQLLARLTRKPNIEGFYPALFQAGPKFGDVVEIISESGTSYLLADIVSEALIQTKTKGGAAAGVLIFNTDGNLDYDNLLDVLRRKIVSHISRVNESSANSNQELNDMLVNLHVVNIYDSTQLYTTIYKLESTLIENSNISIIIFNTLTAFYWSDQGFKITKMDLFKRSLINTIKRVTKEFKTICIYTRPDYFCTNKDSDSMSTEVNYQIQLMDNCKGNYQVIIKSSKMQITNMFQVLNGDLKWI